MPEYRRVVASRGGKRSKVKVDIGRMGVRESKLKVLYCRPERLNVFRVGQTAAIPVLDLRRQIVTKSLVEVLTAEVIVAW